MISTCGKAISGAGTLFDVKAVTRAERDSTGVTCWGPDFYGLVIVCGQNEVQALYHRVCELAGLDLETGRKPEPKYEMICGSHIRCPVGQPLGPIHGNVDPVVAELNDLYRKIPK